jgi:hypothetical protein
MNVYKSLNLVLYKPSRTSKMYYYTTWQADIWQSPYNAAETEDEIACLSVDIEDYVNP